jgi:hypothetical protein
MYETFATYSIVIVYVSSDNIYPHLKIVTVQFHVERENITEVMEELTKRDSEEGSNSSFETLAIRQKNLQCIYRLIFATKLHAVRYRNDLYYDMNIQ